MNQLMSKIVGSPAIIFRSAIFGLQRSGNEYGTAIFFYLPTVVSECPNVRLDQDVRLHGGVLARATRQETYLYR